MSFFHKEITRREFCKLAIKSGIGFSVLPLLLDNLCCDALASGKSSGLGFIKASEALYYKRLDGKKVQCLLCPRMCVLSEGMRGFCRARENRGGKQYTLVYGNPTAVHIDPIEKKPLFHFLPGTPVFSIATAGCNFRCKNCQNWQISQTPPEETYNRDLPPEKVVEEALSSGCPSIAYTYAEPVVFFEYMLDTAKKAKAGGIRNVLHSNGSMNSAPAEEISLYLDGANIDLKGFRQDFYQKIAQGQLSSVLSTLKIFRANKVHLEITNLVIPGHNDDIKTVGEMCKWICGELGEDTPIHFSRFHPTYRLKNLAATPTKTLEKVRDKAISCGLRYVYIGNVPLHAAEHTYCPKDGKVLIRRMGYKILENNIENGRCKYCGTPIPGVWGPLSPSAQGSSKRNIDKVGVYTG